MTKNQITLPQNLRYEWVTKCIEHFKRKYPEYYRDFITRVAEQRAMQANEYAAIPKQQGTVFGNKADLNMDIRLGVMIPSVVMEMVNGGVPDVSINGVKNIPILDPSFFPPGREGTQENKQAKKDLQWMARKYPEFVIPKKL